MDGGYQRDNQIQIKGLVTNVAESRYNRQTLSFSISELNLERYKYVVQVMIGEQRGEGVR